MLAPTLAVVLTWTVATPLLLGCGIAHRYALARLLGLDNGALCGPSDLWIGFGALVAYLEVWSLLGPISAATLVAPILIGGLANALCIRRIRPWLNGVTLMGRRTFVGIGLGSLAFLWLANLAVGRPSSWDSGLYHFPAIEYARRFAAIPGLGNLQERLGVGDAHLLVVAVLGNGPWHNAGFHLANGLLVAMLLVHSASLLVDRGTRTFTRRVARLLIPAALILVAIDPGGRLSSPSLDLPEFVLIAAGTLCLCEHLERGCLATGVGATAAFAAAAATRPQFLPAEILVGAIVLLRCQHRLRSVAVVSVIPLAIFLGWIARQAVLSGYPLLPLKIGALPVDWRLPANAVDTVNAWIRSWARTPNQPPSVVLGSWDWFPGWLRRTVFEADAIGPLSLALFALLQRGTPQTRRLAVLTLGPLVLTLTIWFFTAPAPRFVYGPLWLVPIVLVARGPLDKVVSLVCLGLLTTALIIGGSWRPITGRGSGPLGTFGPPHPAVMSIRNLGGVILSVPVHDDRCWRVLFCTPSVSPRLRLRGTHAASGFRMR